MMSSSRPHTDEDRISSLPDCIIHEIYKYMDTKHAVQTSILSKRWVSVWMSSPYLTFNFEASWRLEDGPDPGRDRGNRRRFVRFIDQVLLLRHPTADIHTFYLKHFHMRQTNKIHAWVTHAMSRNVQVVKLAVMRIDEETVKALCENVRCLMLDAATIVFEDVVYEFVFSCPTMETLVLRSCAFFTTNGPRDERVYYNIKIRAPNLKVFRFQNCFTKNYTIENLSSLVTAVIDVESWVDESDEPRDLVGEILRGLTHATSLTFSVNNFLGLSKAPVTLSTVATFENLKYLKVKHWQWARPPRFCFKLALRLLEKSPNVETLVLDGGLEWATEPTEEDLLAELQSWCKLCHLRAIEIEGHYIRISDCACKFLDCLMRNAMGLKKVFVTVMDTPAEKQNLINLCRRLKVAPKRTMVSSGRIGVSLEVSKKMHGQSL